MLLDVFHRVMAALKIARVAAGYSPRISYGSFVLSNLPSCVTARWYMLKHEPIVQVPCKVWPTGETVGYFALTLL